MIGYCNLLFVDETRIYKSVGHNHGGSLKKWLHIGLIRNWEQSSGFALIVLAAIQKLKEDGLNFQV